MAAAENREELAVQVEHRISRKVGGFDSPDKGLIVEAIDAGIIKLSIYSPRHLSVELDGDGASYDFALSALVVPWVAGLSVLESVEYPTGDQAPSMLDSAAVMLYPTTNSPTHLRFLDNVPSSGTGNIRMNYTTVHTVDDDSSSLDAREAAAAVYFCACVAAELYATEYGQSEDPDLAAGNLTDFGGKSVNWMDISKWFCARGKELLGIGSESSAGGADSGGPVASGWADIDVGTVYGADGVFRSRRQR